MSSTTYGAIKLTTAEEVGTILKKKMGTVNGYKPKDWADTINLLGKLPIRTASGTIAHFTDGADDVPLKSLTATITPKQEGTGDPSPTNPRPISGTSVLIVEKRGTNIWDEETLDGYYDRNNQGAFVPQASYLCSKNLISVKPNTSYFWHIGFQDTFQGRVLFFDIEGNYLSSSEATAPKHSFTTPNDCYFIHWYFYKVGSYTYNNAVSINYPSTDTAYHAYTGTTYTIALGRTVYGGSAEVVGGVGTKNKYIELTGEETEQWRFVDADHIGLLTVADLYSRNTANNLCNLFAVQSLTGWGQLADKSVGFLVSSSSGLNTIGIKNTDWNSIADMKTFLASNTVQIYYELQTPTDFTFTGQPINSYLGVNNVYVDSGEVLDVEYRADIDLLIASLEGNRGLQMLRATPTEETEQTEEDEEDEDER